MKKKYSVIIIILAFFIFPCSVLADTNYNFATEYEREQFGISTDSTVKPDYSSVENIRRNKDVAYYPPQFGVFSGDIPSKQTNPYVENEYNKSTISGPVDYGTYNNGAYGLDVDGVDFMTSTSSLGGNSSTSANTSTLPSSENKSTSLPNKDSVIISYTEYEYSPQYSKITHVEKDSNGNIGTLSIPLLGISKNIKETVGLDVMKNAIGHFEYTSQWDGNVGFASHNSGSAAYFKGIWNLVNGDRIVYKTSLGERIYYVYNKVKVDEYDTSYLGYVDENIITLVTCVEGSPSLRWVIQGKIY